MTVICVVIESRGGLNRALLSSWFVDGRGWRCGRCRGGGARGLVVVVRVVRVVSFVFASDFVKPFLAVLFIMEVVHYAR